MTTRILSLIIFLGLLILTGLGVWNYYVAQSQAQNSMRSRSIISSQQSTIDLHPLFSDYTSLVILHGTSLYDNQDTLATKEQLNTTIQKMGDSIAALGAKEERDQFVKIFQTHVDAYENYTIGLKEKDQAKMIDAKQTLANDAQKLGRLFGGGEDEMNQQTALILSIIDTHAKKDTQKKMLLIKDAGLQATVFADELIAINQQKQHL